MWRLTGDGVRLAARIENSKKKKEPLGAPPMRLQAGPVRMETVGVELDGQGLRRARHTWTHAIMVPLRRPHPLVVHSSTYHTGRAWGRGE